MGELSSNFVMVNLGDQNEPSEAIYKPDGGYIPRILFFKPDGSFLPEVVNAEGNPKYKYYHFHPSSVADVMDDVIEMTKYGHLELKRTRLPQRRNCETQSIA